MPTDGLLGDVCPKGTYCPMGTAFPQPCPPGYYSNSTGNTGIEDCLLCDAGTALSERTKGIPAKHQHF